MNVTKTYEELVKELEALNHQLQEANEIIQAIRTGQVDALVVQTNTGSQLYTLKSADHTYRIFIEKMKEGAVTLDSKGLILYCNSQFASMINMPQTKITGLPMKDFVPEEYADVFQNIINEGWQADSKGEIFFKNKNDELTPFLLSVTSLELDEGAALSIILTDLSLQKENERQLKSKNLQLQEARLKADRMNEELEKMVEARTKDLFLSREYFKFLADNLPVIIWTTDAEGKLDYVNRKWQEYTGFDVEESKTKQSELMHPDDLESSSAVWRYCLEHTQKYEHEFRFRRKFDGLFRWHLAKAIPFKDERGNVKAWIGTNIDIDDQKKELERKDEFIGIASHELKTPLTSLKGYIQLMESQTDLPATASLFVKKANNSLIKLQHLINDLLDVSKIRAGKLKFSVDVFDLSDLIKICIDNCTYIYPSFKIKKELCGKIMVRGNLERLEQVLMNLISNAFKYSPENKEITIRLEKNDDRGIVSVIDCGIGMSESDQTKIFDRFFRIEDNRTQAAGLGMGLYIASEIIKEHEGTMMVKSELNKGSVFSFSLPIADTTI